MRNPRPSAKAPPVAFRIAGPALLRGVALDPVALPPWPDLDDRSPAGTDAALKWLRAVWQNEMVVEAIGHSSPDLAQAVERQIARPSAEVNVAKVHRCMTSLARYLLRLAGRPTPFGLLAGMASVQFGRPEDAGVEWGGDHRVIAQPAAGWLAEIVTALEASTSLLDRLLVVANSTMTVRGGHLVVPHQPAGSDRPVPAEIVIGMTPAVRLIVDAARSPIAVADLAAKLRAEAPTVAAEQIATMLAALVDRRVLITNLHAPSTETDALNHMIEILDSAAADELDDVADLVVRLRRTAALICEHNAGTAGGQRVARRRLTDAMRPDWLRSRPDRARPGRHPLALDLRLDVRAALPAQIARDVEEAAMVLARLSEYPYGPPVWRDYHRAFYERYGIGALVPILELVDPDSGLGFPAGFAGTLVDPPRPKVKERDTLLLSLAQTAVLDGRTEILLDEELITALDRGPTPPRLPPHLELAVRVNASDEQALRKGRYTLEVVQVSRNVGGLVGRFLSVLEPEDAVRHRAAIMSLPGPDSEAVQVQASFPPLDPATAHVTRAPRVLPTVLSLAEHRPSGRTGGQRVLTAADVAVGCDGRRLYLAVPAWGRRIEVSALHTLNPRVHTPPLARFMIELSRAQCALMTGLRWGTAATLPFLPRVRYGRVVLAPATWRLPAGDLPDAAATRTRWDDGLAAWRDRRRMPADVRLVVDDLRLPLDLTHPGHRAVLRRHLQAAPTATLTEIVDPDETGWCGGRPHEVVVPLAASRPPAWPALPAPSPARVVRRGHGDLPGTSPVVYARLYGDMRRQDTVLAEHLPRLVNALDVGTRWWFLRYRDADRLDPHLRLRIRLDDPDAFGRTVQRISAWADDLHRAGLLREVHYPTSYSETGRWGSGTVLAAAENVFAADSCAVLTQLQQARRPERQALIAAHSVAIAVAFLSDIPTAMQWLIDHLPTAPPNPPAARSVFAQAVRIADPDNGFAALRAEAGGTAIVDAWQPRDAALALWRSELSAGGADAAGIIPAEALRHILHGHYIRAYGIDFDDEPVCLRLTRSAALAWAARTRGVQP